MTGLSIFLTFLAIAAAAMWWLRRKITVFIFKRNRFCMFFTRVGMRWIPIWLFEKVAQLEFRLLSSQAEVEQLCRWYASDEPLSKCLGLTEEDWVELGRSWLFSCIGKKDSLVAYKGGRLVGGVLCELNQEPPPNAVPEKFGVLMASMEDLERPLQDPKFDKYRPNYRILMAATNPEERGDSVLGAITWVLMANFQDRNFLIPTSSAWSKKAVERGGAVHINEIRLADWEFDGKKPLAASPPPHLTINLFVIRFGVMGGR